MSKKEFTTAHLEEIDGKAYFVASDDTVDREGEIINVNGWDLKNFKRNPVVLWAHDPREPIGVAESIGYRNINGKKKLVFAPKFHDITQKAREIAEMVKEGWINTVSVGFIGKEMSSDGMTFLKQELLEVSFVAIPANPNATSLALAKGISPTTIKEVFLEDEEKEEEVEEEEVVEGEIEEIFEEAEEEEEESAEAEEIEDQKDLSVILDKITEMSEEIKALRTAVNGKAGTGRGENGDMVRRLSVAIQKQSEALTREKNPHIVNNVSKNITRLAEIVIQGNKK